MCAVVVAAGVVLLVPGTAGARVGGRTLVSPNARGSYNFGRVAPGQSATQVFTISTTRWSQWTGTLAVHLSPSPAFSVVSDGCSGTTLTPAAPSCQVGVSFAPSSGLRQFLGALTVLGTRTHRWGFRTRWQFVSIIVLSGRSGRSQGGTTGGGTGPANLQLSPGTSSGSNAFSYSFGQIRATSQTFALTNVGGAASLPLALNGWSAGGYALSSDSCTGNALAPGASCKFTETWTSIDDPVCDGAGEPVSLSATIDSSDASTTYADVSLSAVCD